MLVLMYLFVCHIYNASLAPITVQAMAEDHLMMSMWGTRTWVLSMAIDELLAAPQPLPSSGCLDTPNTVCEVGYVPSSFVLTILSCPLSPTVSRLCSGCQW